MTKIYLPKTVYETALDRIRWLADEGFELIVSMSGGKDSTVVYELTRIVCEERNLFPLRVFWLDQELEFQSTVDYVAKIMERDDVLPMWYQIPWRLENSTSTIQPYNNVWGVGEEWVREKHPLSIKENTYDCINYDLMHKAVVKDMKGKPFAKLTGMRCEESPNRRVAMTTNPKYKWITWARGLEKDSGLRNLRDSLAFNFMPIYDWSFTDIWKSIHDNGWEYNTWYDSYYRYGAKHQEQRVSNYHHEASLRSLFALQEIEPATYERAVRRLGGLDAAAKFGVDDYNVKEVPPAFKDWAEYRDYLLEHMVSDPEHRGILRDRCAAVEKRYPEFVGPSMYRQQVRAILVLDWGQKMSALEMDMSEKRKQQQERDRRIASGLASPRKRKAK
jgi:predicted phosphoadenosine phosphosulfate sulfurtransferase